MTQREMILAAAVLSLLVLWGGYYTLGEHRQTVDERQSQLLAAREQRDDARLAVARGEQAALQMKVWQERSLPANREVAQSLYRDWLLGALNEAGLTVDDVKLEPRTPRSAAYTSIGYAVEAHGRLQAVTRLLYAFYESPILHQVTRLRLRPASDPGQLGMTLHVEALVVPGATHTDSLPQAAGSQPNLASREDYEKNIEERNLFAVYTPPRPRRDTTVRTEPPPPSFDDAEQAYVTAIVQSGPRLQAWITVRTTGEVLRLFEGDAVKVGLLEGQIVSISPRSLVLETGDHRFLIELGHNLRDGKPADGDSET